MAQPSTPCHPHMVGWLLVLESGSLLILYKFNNNSHFIHILYNNNNNGNNLLRVGFQLDSRFSSPPSFDLSFSAPN